MRRSKYSIKPGKAPSCMGAVVGLFVAGFGVVWTVGALGMGAPWFFGLFGVFFVCFALAGVIYNLVNATSDRGISHMEIIHTEEDPPEFDVAPRRSVDYDLTDEPRASSDEAGFDPPTGGFCPYCGSRLEKDYAFCPDCGREL